MSVHKIKLGEVVSIKKTLTTNMAISFTGILSDTFSLGYFLNMLSCNVYFPMATKQFELNGVVIKVSEVTENHIMLEFD